MMMVQIICDGCYTLLEKETRHELPCSDIDSELDPGWEHADGKNLCPLCVSRSLR